MIAALSNAIKIADFPDLLTSTYKWLRLELATHEHLFHEHTGRQTYPGSAHADTESIYLRWAPSWTLESIFGTTDSIDYPALAALPSARRLLSAAVKVIAPVSLGRVILARLKPGGYISPHMDEGVYAKHFDRFHLVIDSEPGNSFKVGDETFAMRPGELWSFNHHLTHSAVNATLKPRLHMIIDARRA